jgi:hypothetical protein
MTTYDEPKSTTATIPTAHGDTVPLSALEAADRYARGSETLFEQARRLIGQMRDDVALARYASAEEKQKSIGLIDWRLCSLGYVLTAIEEEYMR